MDDELAELILEDFDNAVGVRDTIYYDAFTTLYERIISTIDEYDKAKREEGGLSEYQYHQAVDTANSVRRVK